MADKRLKLRLGGVMRCCVSTLSDYEGIDGEGVEQDEGTVLPCKCCSSSLIVRNGAWEWNRNAELPSAARSPEGDLAERKTEGGRDG